MSKSKYDVFICFKHSTEDGQITEDSFLAERLYDYLTGVGLRVFFSKRELEFLGVSQYNVTINKALEASRFLIAVGCSRRNLESKWVQYEWSSFQNEIRSGTKRNGELYVLYNGMNPKDLPYSLRHHKAFNAAEEGVFEKIGNFINNALTQRHIRVKVKERVPEPPPSNAPPLVEPRPAWPDYNPDPKQPSVPTPGIYQNQPRKKILVPAAAAVLVIVLVIISPWSNRQETPGSEVSGPPQSEMPWSEVNSPQPSEIPESEGSSQQPSETPVNEAGVQHIVIDLRELPISNEALASRIDSGEIPQNVTHLNLTNLTPAQAPSGFSASPIRDLTPLESLTSLIYLHLGGNAISDLTPLQHLSNLAWLDLGANAISDIIPRQHLTNLTVLVLESNQISDLTPLQHLTKLTVLDLWDNEISDITPLESLTNLRELDLGNLLGGNTISDITPMQSLTNLRELNLAGNAISDVTPMQSLTVLTHLYLRGNEISDVTTLQHLTNLTELSLGHNPIREADLEDLQMALPNCRIYGDY